ncbi:phage head-tail adapter protein [Aerococcus kribbianus]|uniref:Phage head-tail adapter protein n=1 Tax=Aerococcus kribbianus TaxID=2999064 RepID=A0A9X3JG93_9LACT|nr:MULTISPECIES: phage head-tail adapter protein [unclassified Aerococcus]MCZ0717833.1 phage head-tail adapter protein [Aerococcus sp. YH-aer221]MCZ0726120.1 phage head-tail adapter protein [Aerococcus sp. YH-aer222]
MHRQYKKPQTDIGELRTPIHFIELGQTGPKPTDKSEEVIQFYCFAEVYNPSFKDMEVMKTKGVEQGVTVKIRDPLGDYYPSNHHLVRINDRRFINKLWRIISIRPDIQNSDFIILVLAVNE